MGTVDDTILKKKINKKYDMYMHTYWESWKPSKVQVFWWIEDEDGFTEYEGKLGDVFGKDGDEPSDAYLKKQMLPKFKKLFLKYKKILDKKEKK